MADGGDKEGGDDEEGGDSEILEIVTGMIKDVVGELAEAKRHGALVIPLATGIAIGAVGTIGIELVEAESTEAEITLAEETLIDVLKTQFRAAVEAQRQHREAEKAGSSSAVH